MTNAAQIGDSQFLMDLLNTKPKPVETAKPETPTKNKRIRRIHGQRDNGLYTDEELKELRIKRRKPRDTTKPTLYVQWCMTELAMLIERQLKDLNEHNSHAAVARHNLNHIKESIPHLLNLLEKEAIHE